MARLLRTAWSQYNSLLLRHPTAAPAVSTGVLMAAGDVLAQTAEGRRPRQLQAARTAKLFALGCCVYGPVLNSWYKFLAAKLQHRRLGFLRMLAADQLLMAPCACGFFVVAVGVMNGASVQQLKAQLAKFPDIMLANYQVWPAVQTVNFLLVPVHLRIIVTQSVALVWNTYMSWMAHK